MKSDHQNLCYRLGYNEDFLDKWGLYVLIAFTIGICVFTYRDYLFFNKAYVFTGFAGDTIGQFFPEYYLRAEKVFSHDLSFWSFRLGFGTNIYELIANLNPFDWLILIFGKKKFIYAIPGVVSLKIIFTGIFFYAYLRKLLISGCAGVIGALLFAFSGYMILNGHWYHYQNYALFVSLMLYFFERWFQNGKWIWLVLTLGLAHLKGVLQLYQIIFFFLLYVLFRLVMENRYSLREVADFILKTSALYIAGVALGAFFIFPTVSIFLASSRGSAAFEHFTMLQRIADIFRLADLHHLQTIFFRYLSNDLLGSFEKFRGVGNYLEAPAAYVGLITLITIPLLFFENSGAKRNAFLVLIASCGFYHLFPFIRTAGNAFASGTYKHTIMYISVILIVLGSYSIDNLFRREVRSQYRLFVPIVIIAAILITIWATREIFLDNEVTLKVLTFLLVYGITFFLFLFKRTKPYVKYVIIAVVVIEVALFARTTVARNNGGLKPDFIERSESYFDKNTLMAIRYTKNIDKGFYRIEKSYRSASLNDAVVQNYFGTSAYYGFASKAIIDFYKTMALSKKSPRIETYRYGLEKRNCLYSLLNVKYYLTHRMDDAPDRFTYLRSFENVHLFKNNDSLPFGSTYNKYIKRRQFDSMSLDEKDSVIINAFVTNEKFSGLAEYRDEDNLRSFWINEKDRNEENFAIDQFREDKIEGTINLDKKCMVFFSIPFDKGWTATVNGKPVKVKKINIGFSGLILDRGLNKVVLRYMPPFLSTGIIITIVSIFTVAVLYCKSPRIYNFRQKRVFEK